MSQSIPQVSDCCRPCSTDGEIIVNIPGPQGDSAYTVAVNGGFVGTEAEWLASLDGANGQSAFTSTTADFIQPAVDADVDVLVENSDWMSVGEDVFIEGGGYYLVIAKPDAVTVTLRNRGYNANSPVGGTIVSSSHVSASGEKGAPGTNGTNATVPLTTLGDVLTYDTAPARLPVGTDGQVLAADSALALGVGYTTVQPNSATDNAIPRFDGAAGKPVPLQDSFMVIADDGALQSSGSGGDARGSGAVDLQVVRAASTQVASGQESVIAGGDKNTASGIQSVVGGGLENTASDTNTTVAGGYLNVADTDWATVGGGDGNFAHGQSSTISGGHSNVAFASASNVSGGKNNVASGENGSVIGGFTGKAYLYCQIAHSAGQFFNIGDAQASELVWSNLTTDATATELFLDGNTASQRAIVPLNCVWGFTISLIGKEQLTGYSAYWQVKGAIKNVGGVALVGSVTTTLVAVDGAITGTWGVAGTVVTTADIVNGSLKIAVTGAAATNIAWVAHARLVEVLYSP